MTEDQGLVELQHRIQQDISVLRRLQSNIEQAGSDDERPVIPGDQSPYQELPTSSTRPCISLAAARRQARALRREEQCGSKLLHFSLGHVDRLLDDFVASETEGPLELPKYTAPQRRQVIKVSKVVACFGEVSLFQGL